MQRRKFLGASLSGLTALGFGSTVLGSFGRRALAEEDAAAPAAAEAEAPPFARARLVEQARRLAEQPFAERDSFAPEQLPEMGYSAYTSIRYRREAAVWADSGSPFRAELFHPGLYFQRPVEIHLVEDGRTRKLAFDKGLFDYADPEIGKQVAEDLEFVGFRAFHQSDWKRDFLSFLGASYFRAVGASMQYGLSARGIAVETSNLGQEEFPSFTAFWLERPEPSGAGLTVHALLDGQSLTGLFTFRTQPTINTEIEVAANLFPRRELANVGFAPITSMYYAGENDWLERRLFRAEAHDSDGLAMHRGNGEWVWRPLANPDAPRVSTFMDETPRGFGLLQRDRNFDNYNDLGADYEDRPNLWIEPQGDWGPGHVELLELPTDDETFDNVVAYWRPQQPLQPGQEHKLSYRMFWGDGMPGRLALPARVTATRIGRAGRPGDRQPDLKFVVDFAGGMLDRLSRDTQLDARIDSSRGAVRLIEVVRIEENGAWRVEFDFEVDGGDTVDLRCFLSLGAQALSETWLYRLEPGEWDEILKG